MRECCQRNGDQRMAVRNGRRPSGGHCGWRRAQVRRSAAQLKLMCFVVRTETGMQGRGNPGRWDLGRGFHWPKPLLDLGLSDTRLWELSLWTTQLRQELKSLKSVRQAVLLLGNAQC